MASQLKSDEPVADAEVAVDPSKLLNTSRNSKKSDKASASGADIFSLPTKPKSTSSKRKSVSAVTKKPNKQSRQDGGHVVECQFDDDFGSDIAAVSKTPVVGCTHSQDNTVLDKILNRLEALESATRPLNRYKRLVDWKPKNTAKNFTAGKVASALDYWQTITSDPWVLSNILGYEVECAVEPYQVSQPRESRFDKVTTLILDNLLTGLENKGIIEPCVITLDSYVSSVFLVPKRDGSHRWILNLKDFNLSVEHHHFKMSTIRDALNMIKEGSWFASIDLKDAYFSVQVHQSSRGFLRFLWHGRGFQFTCLPQGLKSSPRIFTKILRPVFAKLRQEGHSMVGYIDDSLTVDDTFIEAVENILESAGLLDLLGFTIHQLKSILTPTQIIEFIGFILNSISMIVSLPARKKDKIKKLCASLLNSGKTTGRELAQVIGNLVATEPAVPVAPLFYKSLEVVRNLALRESKGNFEAAVCLSTAARMDLKWWIDNIDYQ
ncbi:uncharacterized protein LOC135497676 [Lineus longissimus]|uniref:uncharacterized protein LOC135497676 n=1 Tax=Lineus longissimus TaxID=88925 RepID=UPI00315D3B8B